MPPGAITSALTRDFFDAPTQIYHAPPPAEFHSRFGPNEQLGQASSAGEQNWSDEFSTIERRVDRDTEWVKDFEDHKASEGKSCLKCASECIYSNEESSAQIKITTHSTGNFGIVYKTSGRKFRIALKTSRRGCPSSANTTIRTR